MLTGLTGCSTTPQVPQLVQATEPKLARAHFRAADGAVLPVRSWWPAGHPPQAIVVALHGFNDYGQSFAEPGAYWSRQGIALVAYDQRGFGLAPARGLWAGRERYAADLLAIVRQLRRRYPDVPLYVLGESMGAAVAISALAHAASTDVAGLILSAPAVWSRDLMPWYQRALLALASSTVPEFEVTGRGLKILASDNIDMLRRLGRDPLVIKSTRVAALEGLTDLMDDAQTQARALKLPVLVLYGEQDQVIPKQPVNRMLVHLAGHVDARYVLYPQGFHLLFRDRHAGLPMADVVVWVSDRHARLPSGFERILAVSAVSPRD